MSVTNVHERILHASAAEIGILIDSLSSAEDKLWPKDRWPAMVFNRPLGVGAVGGHGPIRYAVESYRPGEYIRFRFLRPRGFLGFHEFQIEPMGEEKATLRHNLRMQVEGRARLIWPLVIGPLHDALLEDALDRAEVFTGGKPERRNWPIRVRILRRLMGAKRTATKGRDGAEQSEAH